MTTNYLPYELLRAQSWTSTNFDSFTSQGPYGFTVDSDGTGGGTAKATIPTYVTKGLQYRLTFVSTINSGSGTITVQLTDSSGTAISDSKTFSSSGSKTFLLTATKSAASAYLEVSNPESATINYSLSGIGLTHAFKISPKAANLKAVATAIDSVSPFTRKMQRFVSRGQNWELELQFPPMPREYAKLWLTWITDNNLGGDFFYYRPILESMPNGSISTSFERVVSTGYAINTASVDADYDSVTGVSTTVFTADSDGSDDSLYTSQYAAIPIDETLLNSTAYDISFDVTINSGSGTVSYELVAGSGTDFENQTTVSNTGSFNSGGSKTGTLTTTAAGNTNNYIIFYTPSTSTIDFSISNFAITRDDTLTTTTAVNSSPDGYDTFTSPSTTGCTVGSDGVNGDGVYPNDYAGIGIPTIVNGATYDISVDITNNSGSTSVTFLLLAGSSNDPATCAEVSAVSSTYTTNGTKTFSLTATGAGDTYNFLGIYTPATTTGNVTISNASVTRTDLTISTSTAINSSDSYADYDTFSGASTTGFTATSDGTDEPNNANQYAGFPLSEVLEDGAVYTINYVLTINSGSGTITPGLYSSDSATVLETNSNGDGTARTTSGSYSDTITVSGTIGAYSYVSFKTAATDTINFTVASMSVTKTADHFITDGTQDTQSTALYLAGPASEDEVLSPGDYIEANEQLFRVRQGTLDTNANGDFTPYIWPNVRSQIADDLKVYYQGPRGKFILEDTSFDWSQSTKGLIDGFKIIAREYF